MVRIGEHVEDSQNKRKQATGKTWGEVIERGIKAFEEDKEKEAK